MKALGCWSIFGSSYKNQFSLIHFHELVTPEKLSCGEFLAEAPCRLAVSHGTSTHASSWMLGHAPKPGCGLRQGCETLPLS